MITTKRTLLAIAALAAMSSASYATILLPGGAVAAAPVAVSGTAITVDTNAGNFTGLDAFLNVIFTGNQNTTVFAGDTNNPLGGLTFVYHVHNNVGSVDAIDRVTLDNFTGFATDVGFIPSADQAPVVINRSVNSDVVGFDFSSIGFPNQDINAGQNSVLLVIRTNATFDAFNNMTLIDGGTGSVASLGPIVPEPASLGLLATGVLALAARRRR